MSSLNGEESVNDTAADGEAMLRPLSLCTNLDAVDRSLEEMVTRAALQGCAPTKRVPTTSGPTELQGLARTHKRIDSGPSSSTGNFKATRAGEQ